MSDELERLKQVGEALSEVFQQNNYEGQSVRAVKKKLGSGVDPMILSQLMGFVVLKFENEERKREPVDQAKKESSLMSFVLLGTGVLLTQTQTQTQKAPDIGAELKQMISSLGEAKLGAIYRSVESSVKQLQESDVNDFNKQFEGCFETRPDHHSLDDRADYMCERFEAIGIMSQSEKYDLANNLANISPQSPHKP